MQACKWLTADVKTVRLREKVIAQAGCPSKTVKVNPTQITSY